MHQISTMIQPRIGGMLTSYHICKKLLLPNGFGTEEAENDTSRDNSGNM